MTISGNAVDFAMNLQYLLEAAEAQEVEVEFIVKRALDTGLPDLMVIFKRESDQGLAYCAIPPERVRLEL